MWSAGECDYFLWQSASVTNFGIFRRQAKRGGRYRAASHVYDALPDPDGAGQQPATAGRVTNWPGAGQQQQAVPCGLQRPCPGQQQRRGVRQVGHRRTVVGCGFASRAGVAASILGVGLLWLTAHSISCVPPNPGAPGGCRCRPSSRRRRGRSPLPTPSRRGAWQVSTGCGMIMRLAVSLPHRGWEAWPGLSAICTITCTLNRWFYRCGGSCVWASTKDRASLRELIAPTTAGHDPPTHRSRHPGRWRWHAAVPADQAARQAGGADRRRLPPDRRADVQLPQLGHQQDLHPDAGGWEAAFAPCSV